MAKKQRQSVKNARRSIALGAIAFGLIGPALAVSPLSGGTPLNRGESVNAAWSSTAKLLRRASRKVGNELKTAS